MKKVLILFLALALTACLSPSGGTAPQTVELTSTPEATVTATITPAHTATPTEIPFAALTPEEQAAQYLAGKVQDVSELNFEQRKDFSIALAEKKNEQRGDNPIIYNGTIHKIESERNYIDPITGDYLPVDNGTTAKEQTIKMYVPRIIDDEGFTHVYYNGEWVKIEGSQNIQYDNFETFKWPLEGVEAHFKADDGYQKTMTPIFFSDKVVGQINIFGIRAKGFITGFILNQKDPFLARRMIIAEGTALYGKDVATYSGSGFREGIDFFDKLKTSKLYYVMYLTDQRASFIRTNNGSDKGEVTANYSGLVPSNLTYQVIVGELEHENMLLIDGRQSMIVEPGD